MGTNYPDRYPRSMLRTLRQIVENDAAFEGAVGLDHIEALANETKADYNGAKTLINSLKAKYNLVVTMANANKAKINILVAEVADLRARIAEFHTLADDIIDKYGDHLADSVAHNSADVTNTLTASAPTAVSATVSTVNATTDLVAESNSDAGTIAAEDLA
jgi:delta-aminolevulinic acid dehydratase/porphobilinogen synthase